MPKPADWTRLGEMLQQQRVRLDPRYRSRQVFSDDRGINYRLSQDLETGARGNYERSTLTHAEMAYGWMPGSFAAVLAGGDPVQMPPRPEYADPAEQRIADEVWEANISSGPELARGFVTMAVAIYREQHRQSNGDPQAGLAR